MEGGPEVAYRPARASDLPRVLDAYWKCFDETQRMRTVAHSPFLFRYFHRREMRRGRCQIALAVAGSDNVGFCIVRQTDDSPAGPWLLSAIGVVPNRRAGGVARHLFEMVATRPLTLTVEEGGPVAFYEKLAMRKGGSRTLIYFRRAQLELLRSLPAVPASDAPAIRLRPLHWSAFLIEAEGVSDTLVRQRATSPWSLS